MNWAGLRQHLNGWWHVYLLVGSALFLGTTIVIALVTVKGAT